MHRDRPVLLDFCLLKFDELVALVGALDDATANSRPEVAGANSPVAILVHCCGMMRHWSSTVNRGIAVPRDRDAEFAAVLPVAAAIAQAATVREAFAADVLVTDLAGTPAAVPPGRDDFWTSTCHGVLLHVFEELCQHLGQAEITRDVLTA